MRSRRFGPCYEKGSEEEEEKETFSTSFAVNDIRNALGIDMNVGRGMPSLKNWQEKSKDEFDAESKERLVNFLCLK